MKSANEFLLAGARVIDPFNGVDSVMDIGVAGGLIVDPSELKKPRIVNLKGHVLAPGFIDMHVHLRQPGRTSSETIHTGAKAAAAGGFTSILAMPNTSPCIDTPGGVHYVKTHAEREAIVKVLVSGAMSKGLEGKEMAGIGGLKAAGIVAITDDGGCIQNHELMRHVVEYSRSFRMPILDHCEDKILASEGVMHEGYWSVLIGMKGISSASEEMMVARDIILARMADWQIHIQHISCKEAVKLVRNARKDGIAITAEATPHHISLTDEEVKRFDTNYKMNPPLRSEDDRMAVIEGLKDGTITVIASDHAPHTETDKLVEFDSAPFGIVGLETSVPVCMTELYHKGYLTLPELVSKYTKGPSDVLLFEGKGLTLGSVADITVINPDLEFVIDSSTFMSKSRNTPYHGYKAKGRPVATFVNGKLVFSLLAD